MDISKQTPVGIAVDILGGAVKEVANATGEAMALSIETNAQIRAERDLAPAPTYATAEQMEAGFDLPDSGYFG